MTERRQIGQGDEPEMRIDCQVWHSRLLTVTPTGITVKCKSCRGILHSIPRLRIEHMWQEFDEMHSSPHDEDVA